MAITVQSIFNPSDVQASAGQSYASVPDNPFAMLFASQLQSVVAGAMPLASPSSEHGHPLKAKADDATTLTAQDPLGLFGSLMASVPFPVPAIDNRLAASIDATPQVDVQAVTTARLGVDGTVQEKMAALTAAPSPVAGQVAAATSIATPAPVTADEVAAAFSQVLGVTPAPKNMGNTNTTPAMLKSDNGETASLLSSVPLGSNDKSVALPLNGGALSAAVAARVSLREDALRDDKLQQAEGLGDLKALPPSFAAVRQELPSGQQAAGSRVNEAVIGGTMDRSKQWGEAFGNQVMKAVERQMETTRFHVTPEKLGPIEVTITMNKDQAHVVLTAASPQAREIIESHLPALSKMMDQAGVQLADAQVSSQQQGQSRQQHEPRPQARRDDGEAVPSLMAELEQPATQATSGVNIAV